VTQDDSTRGADDLVVGAVARPDDPTQDVASVRDAPAPPAADNRAARRGNAVKRTQQRGARVGKRH
jgi:hypothetical protein